MVRSKYCSTGQGPESSAVSLFVCNTKVQFDICCLIHSKGNENHATYGENQDVIVNENLHLLQGELVVSTGTHSLSDPERSRLQGELTLKCLETYGADRNHWQFDLPNVSSIAVQSKFKCLGVAPLAPPAQV
jgi:hypothetical protein